jgi:hypothetical protein
MRLSWRFCCQPNGALLLLPLLLLLFQPGLRQKLALVLRQTARHPLLLLYCCWSEQLRQQVMVTAAYWGST